MERVFKFKKWHRHLVGLGMTVCLMIITLVLAGCAESISDKFLKQVDNKNITFEQLIKNPDQYVGNSILLGGVIVSTENKNDGTLLEIYQTELDSSGEPKDVDISKGRFLAWDKDFLDSQIFRSGRRVTIVGVVKGVEVRKVGQVDYHYPYLVVKDIYLWRNVRTRMYPRYYWDYYGPMWGYPYPYGWYYPYWGFYYHYYPRYRH